MFIVKFLIELTLCTIFCCEFCFFFYVSHIQCMCYMYRFYRHSWLFFLNTFSLLSILDQCIYVSECIQLWVIKYACHYCCINLQSVSVLEMWTFDSWFSDAVIKSLKVVKFFFCMFSSICTTVWIAGHWTLFPCCNCDCNSGLYTL